MKKLAGVTLTWAKPAKNLRGDCLSLGRPNQKIQYINPSILHSVFVVSQIPHCQAYRFVHFILLARLCRIVNQSKSRAIAFVNMIKICNMKDNGQAQINNYWINNVNNLLFLSFNKSPRWLPLFSALIGGIFHLLIGPQGFMAYPVYCFVMHKRTRAQFFANKPKAFAIIKPFHSSDFTFH